MNQFEEYDTNLSGDEIRQVLHLFWSWAWLIALFGLLGAGAAYLFSTRITPIYQASTRLLISDPPAQRSADATGIVNSQTVVRTYIEMMLERPVLEGVIAQLGLSTGPEGLKNDITIQRVQDTQLVLVTVKHPSPDLAAQIANTLAQVFIERIRGMQSERFAATREGLAKQVSDMDGKIEQVNQALLASPNPDQQLQLEARLTEYQGLYADLVTNFEQVRLAEAQNTINVVVSEAATIPTTPISPKPARTILLAAVVGLMLGAGLVYLIDLLDDTIRNPDELRRRFGLPVLGMIASYEGSDQRPISLSQPRSPVSEAFRALRTNVLFAEVDKPLKRVMLTSATPQEGKTTVTANLAVVLAQGERKVAVIDADLRRPTLHHKFGLYNHVGLSDLFLVQRPLESFPQGVVKFNEATGLSVITSGKIPPNPAELLSSQKMKHFLALLYDEFDMLLVDTPPLLAVTDSAALAPFMDGVILVARPGVTKFREFQQAFEQLQTVNARVLGVVLNDVNPRNRRYGYYYHRYYSKYTNYYGEGRAKRDTRPSGRRRAPEPAPEADPNRVAR